MVEVNLVIYSLNIASSLKIAMEGTKRLEARITIYLNQVGLRTHQRMKLKGSWINWRKMG